MGPTHDCDLHQKLSEDLKWCEWSLEFQSIRFIYGIT